MLRHELTPADLAQPVTRRAARSSSTALFDARVLVDGALRVKIYRAPTGIVTYSNVHSLIGTKTDDLDEFNAVLGGQRRPRRHLPEPRGRHRART